MDTDQYDKWNKHKKKLNNIKLTKKAKVKKIYWLSLGLNVGAEVYGKDEFFTRPVLVLNSFYNGTFLGIPLSSKTKNKKGFLFHKFKDNKGTLQVALLGQMRVFDTKRIRTYIGKINNDDFEKIKNKIAEKIISPARRQGNSKNEPIPFISEK
ncbi:type II toxin-antitoxin system PemK/MazF family toxin [Campylobacter aviculae]|uniref:Toxin-antitoxin system protein n=1 Tax=Campylobacter aviculae TaxID=2510190 RepID=A0A4V6DWJ5_9BACT|nr:type II toxin-antitoxin system PemK/MazF family toxin [Campylobacter aviculae]TKX32412.1 toxin-antitoxin system protein [Campylobacter aviculae]